MYFIKHRFLRFLVEHLGFRSLVLETDWTIGIHLDEYLCTGRGDPQALLAATWGPLQTNEILDAIRWMRFYNLQHPTDTIRVVGGYFGAGHTQAYDAVADYVRCTMPERLDELETYFSVLRPTVGIDEHIEWYSSQRDKQLFIDHAQLAYQLVADLPTQAGHALALQHARFIVGFYEYQGLVSLDLDLDQRIAKSVIWWHEHTGDKVVYWGGIAHTANGSLLATGHSAGSYLRGHFGSGYASIGLTFHHGSGADPIPFPSSEFAEAVLGEVGLDTYLLDLHAGQPDSVQDWLNAPTKTRVIGPYYDPEKDSLFHMYGSLANWFDIIIHTQEITPARPLA
ncbi:erythromycin esterase family protein [Paenibacillus sepulcri]|uniref:Erythromycin esterase family protein n=1 Tax=Paenibacillus sepulcri TaxID=359917 RepID=A0ABS7BZF0_9BACL|nr:erythromycin esterase family protein [Paenibacillus sepulcri]